MQKAIHLIEKNLITPEERYWMIEEYNSELRVLNAKEEIAKNLLTAGVAIEIIVKTTGLTVAEIESLPNQDLDNE